MEPKTYKLTTLADVFEVVTLDNVRTLCDDLKGILFTFANAKMVVEQTGGKVEDLKINPSIMWTDDNISQVTTKIFGKDPDNEIFHITTKPTDD